MSRLSKFSRSIKGKIVLVTGAASGMGRATAELFSDEGAVVIVSDLYQYSVDNVVDKIKKNESDAEGYVLDISDKKNIQDVVKQITNKYGLIDILINNAGIALPTSIDNDDFEVYWDKTHNVLLKGQAVLIRECLPFIEKSNTPRIVNISSINGQKGQLGQANYSAAKAGELGFTKSLALEGARKGITVNAICPGYINTDMVKAMSEKAIEATESQIPVGHLGQPNDIARCVQFLVADEASFITGSTVTANGGHYLI